MRHDPSHTPTPAMAPTAVVRGSRRSRAPGQIPEADRPRRLGRLRRHMGAGLVAAALMALAIRAVWPLAPLLL